MFVLTVILSLYCVLSTLAQNDSQVLMPIKEGTNAGIVLIPGGLLYPPQYRELGTSDLIHHFINR